MNRILSIALLACALSTQATDLTDYVNPMIGTGGHGHTFPGAIVPHGMIQPSPDTRINEWDACSGYHYTDSLMNGFSQSHLSGTGCADYGDFLLMPTVGEQVITPQNRQQQNRPYASRFSHATEVAEPGYYSVFLDRYGVKAEVTATDRAAIYRFTFPEGADAGMILDMDYSIQNQKNTEMKVDAPNDRTILAFKETKYWAWFQQLAMCAEFSTPFTLKEERTDTTFKVLMKFPTLKPGEPLYVKVGVSAVDWDGAQKNLQAEIPGWDFEGVRAEAKRKWNGYLSTIDITTDNPDDKTIFYTALYHTAVCPNLFQDVDGRYLGMDRKPHMGDPEHPVYTVFSLWDTHRALHPLMTIINPRLNNEFIRSLLLKHDEGGLLPMWELAGNYTATMTGYHAVSLMADALAKGISDFDPKHALKAGMKSAGVGEVKLDLPEIFQNALMPKSKEWKNTLGWIPWDSEHESVAKGLEYAYDDWCIARLAEAAGDSANTARFDTLGQAYRHYFDPETRFMRGKDKEGHWHEPFNPRSSNHRSDDYCEGTAWQRTCSSPPMSTASST